MAEPESVGLVVPRCLTSQWEVREVSPAERGRQHVLPCVCEEHQLSVVTVSVTAEEQELLLAAVETEHESVLH